MIAGGALTYFLIYMYGEVNHPERGPLVRAMNAATEASGGPDVRHRGHDRGLRHHRGGLLVRQIARLRTAMQNGFYQVRVTGRDRLLDRDGQVPARLPGAHRCLRLRDGHRRRPL